MLVTAQRHAITQRNLLAFDCEIVVGPNRVCQPLHRLGKGEQLHNATTIGRATVLGGPPSLLVATQTPFAQSEGVDKCTIRPTICSEARDVSETQQHRSQKW
jgi:hypothetical protein